MRIFTIGANDAGQRLDKFLKKSVPFLPKSLLYKYIRIKRIKINGKKCDIAQKTVLGDKIELYISDDFFSDAQSYFLNAPAELTIVYEDENILLVDKPAGMLVHEGGDESRDTLINRILHYLHDKGEYIPDNELSFTPALCNRIDRNTGGIVIAAKNFEALQILNQKIKDREIEKLYLCLVHGKFAKKSNILKGYHIKDNINNTVKISQSPAAGAKTAITKYRVLKEIDDYSLLEIELITGRTHQIRAHMSSIGHPLVGDTKYGVTRMNKSVPYKSQALYSYRLTFKFKTGAGILSYLKDKSFEVTSVPFLSDFDNKHF